ncbi:MAG TPA: undecaprenyldiphospho-muramoylpentapeptide beta-N-acetylglucosaminyltransferase [Acidobacteriaceae bacterium]|nr:undecaprenyldiphospho-muramoylpentapeptide beta-N-acetylglucosaminyltransferase [Acidobacteriaceae bacterium]
MAPRTTRPTPLRIAIAGGGTGGHVIPALAIGRELRDHHHAELLYIGTGRGLETKLVPAAGFPLELVRSGQLKNVSLTTRLKTLTDLPHGVLRCLQLLRSFNPQAVVGVGGYASGPAILAAAILRIPTLAYEPNAAPGLTNRIAGRFTSAAAVNFPQTTQFFRNAEVTGVPVRPEIFDIPPKPAAPDPDTPLRLLVTAGSQGAAVFNDLLPRITHRLFHQIPDLTIVHQAGPRHLETTRAAYSQAGLEPGSGSRVQVDAFLNDMPAQYAAADLILARSGSTVAELCAAGRASLLIPFPQAADDHQRKNAEVLAQAGAAQMLLQANTDEHTLYEALLTLLTDHPRRAAMASQARSLARPGALQRIAVMVLRIATR